MDQRRVVQILEVIWNMSLVYQSVVSATTLLLLRFL